MAIEPAANCGSSNLNCETDSVTICPGDVEIPVVICQTDPIPVCFTMTCETDSITVCVPYDYPEDFPHVSGDVGAFVLAVRNDSGLPLAADGDYIPFTTDETGALRVAATVNANVVINYEYAEDSPHVTGDIGAFVLAVRNDAGTPLAGDGDYIPFTTDATGALRVTTSGGASLDCLTDSVTICPGEDPIIVEATNFDIRNLACGQDSVDACVTYDYAEDSPHVSGDVGAFVLAVRNDGGLPLAANGDYIPFTTDATGALRVNATFTGDITVALDCATDSVTICPGADPIIVEATSFDIRPLDCLTDSIEVCQGTSPWTVDGTVELGAATLAALETITVLQGTSPWVIGDGGGSITVDGTVELGAATLAALETITVLQGTSPWVIGDGGGSITVDAVNLDIRDLVFATDKVDVSGSTVALDAGTLAALETITVLQGTSPWVIGDGGGSVTVDGTVAVTQSTSPWVVSGTVELGAATLAALETITVLQGTSPWVVSGTVTADTNFDYAEDALHVTGDVGAFVLGVRNDSAATLTSGNGDYSPFATDAAGRIGVSDLGGSITVDGTVAVTQSTSPWVTSLDAPTLAALESITVQNGAGAAAVNIQDGGNSITVDGTVSVSGTVTTGDNKVEDVPHVTADVGSFVLGVRNDAAAVRTTNDGDYSPISTDSAGRVGISDLGGSISIDDNAGSITVDGTVAVTQSTSPWVTSLDAASLAALESITVQNGAGAAAVNIQDGGNSITVDGSVSITGSVTTGDNKAEDAVHTTGDTGSFILGVRNDAAAVRTNNDGDYSPVSTDSAGRVGISDLGGSISIDDNAGSITVDGTVAVTQSTSPWVTSLDAASLAALESITVQNGAGAGAVNIQDGGNSITVDGTVAVTQSTSPWVVSGTVTADTNYDYAEDAVHVSGDPGAFVLGVRNDAAATRTNNDGDYSPISTDAAGRVGISDLGGSISIDDNAGSITVDGTVAVTQSTSPWVTSLDAASLAALESITVQNGAGAGAVNIQDGGNSITVDGTVNIGTMPEVEIKNDTGNPIPTTEQTGLVPKIYDYIDLNYTGDDVTQVIYKTGGSGGTTVATLTLVYSSPGVLDTVTRT